MIRLIHSSQSECSGGYNICSCSIDNAKAGNIILCAFTHREDIDSYSDDFTLLGGSEGIEQDGTIQYLKFAYKRVESDGYVNFFVRAVESNRIYIVMMEFTNGGCIEPVLRNDYCESGTSTLVQAIGKQTNEAIVWGTHCIMYASGRNNTTVPTDLERIDGSETAERLNCWFDDGTKQSIHYFSLSSGDLCQVNAVQLIEKRKFLILSEGQYYTVADGALSAVSIESLTAQSFKDYGADDIPDGSLLIPLVSPSVLAWQESVEAPRIKAQTVTTPQIPQRVIAEVSVEHESIAGVKSCTIICSDNSYFSLSFDNGATWEVFNGESWETDIGDGMTKAVLSAITTSQWKEKLELAETKKFLLRFKLTDINDSVTNIRFDFINT